MRSVIATSRVCAATFASLLVVLAGFGWLYLFRFDGPRPRVAEALPLDELARHDGVSLAWFVAVWGVAALLLGALARAARIERLTAALWLALGTAAIGYLTTGVSIAIVRQIPADEAFRAASQLKAIYVPAVLAGLAGALLGVRRETQTYERTRNVLALAVAGAGALDLLYTMLPGTHMLIVYVPHGVRHVAAALDVPIGVALLVTARGLWRGKRRALWIACGLLAGSEVLHVLHAWNRGAIGTALLLVALVARRRDFEVSGDPEASPRVLARLFASLAAVYAYGLSVLWINRIEADRPYTIGFALRETTRALLGLTLRGSPHLAGHFGGRFAISVLLLGTLALGWTLVAWLAPWRYRHKQATDEGELARRLVRAWGADTLSPFVLRADKSYFFCEQGEAFLAYKVVGGVAIVSGDPIGSPAAADALIDRFLQFAHARDWRVAVLGASQAQLQLYARRGLHALYHGDEAVVDTGSFTLEGRQIRKVRQSVHRLTRLGYSAGVLRPSELSLELRAELEAVARAWRGAEPERGFVMALDALFTLGDDEAVFVIGFDPDGSAAGFLHFAITHGASALSLSSMPRLRSTPNGFNEWLVCTAIAWAREHGFDRVSLNFSPFAALLAPDAELSGFQRIERQALRSLKGHFQLDNLLHFNRKFFPLWERRFVVYERKLDLPRVGIAALAAEAYLPFTGRERH
jgi:lysyl-tRNA synthetase class 2